ncbi:MAG: putative Fe-S protein YdhL (DUF1289 family) [Paracoccaceae bacterium]|jgi:predicted Fe-S protein YdhL (DUF1289 family)
MTDQSPEIWARAEPDSPCTKVCVIHPGARLCVGCLRSIDEITAWARMTYDERRAVMATLPDRAPLLTAKSARPSARRAAAKAARDDGQDGV